VTNPYRDLPDRQFWRRAVAGVELHRFDPMSGARFGIAPTDGVFSGGAAECSSMAADAGANVFMGLRCRTRARAPMASQAAAGTACKANRSTP
jgi:hypothetical protein